MRDLFVTLVIFGSLPLILYRPYIGVIMWSWVGYMNPHRLSWGFAADFPFAMIIAVATMVAILFSNESKRIPWTRETAILLLFIVWMAITTVFAVHPELAQEQLTKVVKIQLMTFITLMLMVNKFRIDMLVWTIVLSLGFFGAKGGLFTILSGGGYHVLGPPGTFIGGNNELGLAMLVTIPLIRYLQLQTHKVWVRHGLMLLMLLTIVAVLGTQSRGALVGLGAMGLMLILKSRKKLVFMLVLAMAVPVALSLMPESWHARMDSIKNYEADESVQGRFRAWNFAWETALDRPLTGDGFQAFAGQTDAHSIYFEVLGEHGFVGLAIFLLLGTLVWRSGTWIIRRSRNNEDCKWMMDLAAMLQVSMVGYAVAGAALGLAYFDLVYHFVAIMILVKVMLISYLARQEGGAEAREGTIGGFQRPAPKNVRGVRALQPLAKRN